MSNNAILEAVQTPRFKREKEEAEENMNVVNDKASLLHADQVIHRNIRLSNIVFAEYQSSLIDFDFSGERGVKKYPEGYNCEILDGFRHADAKENTFLEIEHDFSIFLLSLQDRCQDK